MTASFEIVVTAPLNASALDALAAHTRDPHLHVHKLYEQVDPAAFLRAVGPRVQAVVSAAPILAEGYAFATNAAFLAHFPNLKLIANLAVGYDNIDAAYAAGHGIILTNTPDVLTDETADLAMGLLLATVRELPQADAYLRAGHWQTKPYRLTASLRGRRMGIVGLGRIGQAIATRAAAFGVDIAYHSRTRKTDVAYPFYESPVALAQACDILMVVAPGGPATRHIIDAKVLAALGPEGILINVARGSLVDESALVAALQNKQILAAGLDVFAHEPHVPAALVAMDQVVLLPHVGSGSRHTRAAMEQLLVDNVVAVAQGHPPLTPVKL